jgi:hypothetical protein
MAAMPLLSVSCSAASRTEGDPTASVAGSEDIVVNELSAVGSAEWLELANKGSAAFDLSGYGVADSDKSTGKPKVTDAVHFPAGTTIEPGGRVVIVLSKAKGSTVGPHDKADCLPNGPASCFFATFGVSAANAESVHFLAPNDALIATTAYPTGVAIDPQTDKTACRIPDLTGPFASCSPTPGSVNASP